ncbi:ATP-binding cassette domain-containing protein [Bacillus cereus]|uniref:ATP-binding cassette domain-containing protein n=1 Tax=Bacillus cereus TaxID=1396 RepID=UPI0018DB168C
MSFNYKNEEPLLKDFSFEINENQIVSFVGKSGSGKSTLAKLLIRFLETSKNTIYVNDIDINDINLKSLREKVCYINDKRFFIPGTIRENLTLGIAFRGTASILEKNHAKRKEPYFNPLRVNRLFNILRVHRKV